MKWEVWGNYARRCVQHKLSIAKASVQGQYVYTLFKLRQYEWLADTILGHFKTFEAAKKAAEDLINEQQRTTS